MEAGLASRAKRNRRLAIIVAVLTVFGCLAISDRLATQRAVAAEHDRLANVARLTASSFQRQVDKFRLVATTLSADPDVGRLLDTRTSEAAARLNERLADLSAALDASVIYLIDAKGTTIASSNWRQPDSFLNENYGFRAYFTQAMARGEWEQYALGTRSRIPGLFVARRVDTGGGANGVIVVKIRFDRLEREWAGAAGTAFVTSQQGVILVSSTPSWRFQTIRKLDNAEQERLRAQVEFGDAPLQQHPLFAANKVTRGTAMPPPSASLIAAEEKLPNGWSVHVLAPIETSVAAARTSGRLVVLLAAGLIAALVGLYALRRRAIIAREQRESAARLTDLKDRLIQANKLSSLGQMAAGIGHEINQPLTAIGLRAGNARALIDSGRTAEAQAALSEIAALTARMGAITGELRRFARRGDGQVGKVSLQAALAGTQLLLGDRIRTNGTRVIVDPEDVAVVGDQGRLEQVLVNLFQNALDAMEAAAKMPSEVRIDIRLEDNFVRVIIADTGPGVPADIGARLFQPFRTSKTDGLGLGLVICRDIVTEFGGELDLLPSDRGAAFALKLKVAP